MDINWHYDHLDKDYGSPQPAKYFRDYLYELDPVDALEILDGAILRTFYEEDDELIGAELEIIKRLQSEYAIKPETEQEKEIYAIIEKYYDDNVRDQTEWE